MNVSRFRTVLVTLSFVLGLSACAELPSATSFTTPDSSSRQMLGVDKYVGVLAVKQSPQVDRMVLGRNADQYFMDIYRAIDSGKSGFIGAGGKVTLTVRSKNEVHFEQVVTLGTKGIVKIVLPTKTRLPQDAALCVETLWPIAHQRLRPAFAVAGQHVACTSGASLYRYLVVDDRGDTPGDAFGVIAIKAGG